MKLPANSDYFKLIIPLILFLLKGIPVSAQTTDSLRMHSTLFGVGSSNILDSYLSPYSQTGTLIRIIRNTERRLRRWNGRISYRTLTDFDVSALKNPARNVNTYAGGLRYSNAWLYNFDRPGRLTFQTGLQASGYLGCVYNERNSNNPAQGKLDLMIDLTGSAQYKLRVSRKDWLIRYTLSVPFVGLAFSPQYGQSYYEMFVLGDYDHNCVFANFVNMPSMRHLLTVDIPIGHNLVRVGYAGEFMQARFNGLRYHSYSHGFMIGFTKYFVRKR